MQNAAQKSIGDMNKKNNFQTFSLIIIILMFMGLLIFFHTKSYISEGMIMNKIYSPGYCKCVENDKCAYDSPKWIIAVQNGDKKDWWYVSENYYNNVSIGDWVKKYEKH